MINSFSANNLQLIINEDGSTHCRLVDRTEPMLRLAQHDTPDIVTLSLSTGKKGCHTYHHFERNIVESGRLKQWLMINGEWLIVSVVFRSD